MTWENPAALWLLAAALPLVLLHLRWRRRRVVEVTSLAVWLDLGPAGAPRRGFRHVTDPVALFLLLVALGAFATAAASPVRGSPPSPGRRLAIVLDVSASMNARAGGDPAGARVRFDDARAAALAALDRLGPADDVVVWLASETPRVLVDPTRDLASARAAIRAAQPTLLRGDLPGTLRLARLALERFSDPALLVLTDAPGAASLDGTAGAVPATVGAVGGASAANAGIFGAWIDPGTPGARDEVPSVVLRIATTDGPPAARSVVVLRDGREVLRRAVDVPLSDSSEERIPLGDLPDAGGTLELRLEPGDDFAGDDATRFLLPRPRPLRVAVTAPGLQASPFLLDALRACGDLVDPAGAVLAQPDAPASVFTEVDVVVAQGIVPPALPTDRPFLLFDAPGREVEDPILWAAGSGARHPLLAGVDLAPLRMDRARVVAVPEGGTVLAETDAGPVAACGLRGGARVVHLGFRPDATTLPLEAAFPLLVRNALRWLPRPPLLPPQVVAGSPFLLTEDLPRGIGTVWMEGPVPGVSAEVPVVDGQVAARVAVPPPGGPWTLRLRGVPGSPETAVAWFPPEGFRLGADAGPAAADASAAVASIPDRRGDTDTRERFARTLAAIGAAALAAGAMLLGGRSRVPHGARLVGLPGSAGSTPGAAHGAPVGAGGGVRLP